MIHVILRITIWVLVLGIGYLVLGPEVFDSSSRESPFQGQAQIFLPPAKSPRLLEYEQARQQRALSAEEQAEYRRLVQERQSRFWQQEGVSVEEALSGIKTHRQEHLATILEQRGVSPEEAAIFFLVLDRDHPELLADRE